jgi:hypothetical protein
MDVVLHLGRGARLVLLLSVLAVILVMVGPPRADADKGALHIGAARLGMTGHQARSALGPPQRTSTRRRYGSPIEWQWHYPARLTLGFERFGNLRRVYRVRTRSPRDRFPSGFHVGSREAAMRHGLIGETCAFQSRRYETTPPGFICEWGDAGFPCGPRLVVYMHHRHRRIDYIELWGLPRKDALASSLGLALPLDPIAYRGCF